MGRLYGGVLYEPGGEVCVCEYDDWSDYLHGDNDQGVRIALFPIFEGSIYLFFAEK